MSVLTISTIYNSSLYHGITIGPSKSKWKALEEGQPAANSEMFHKLRKLESVPAYIFSKSWYEQGCTI